ncbi:cilia- and flagella-associated protein 184 [Scleropages formosus]|uniref:cilia- and flagella-associated protein 184 n=1 Tax=Scleropages formosus TaxID=113540 RepID=UPI0010FABB65|nr:coiled-coil domain-containing protein 96 [Scleropages formosus]
MEREDGSERAEEGAEEQPQTEESTEDSNGAPEEAEAAAAGGVLEQSQGGSEGHQSGSEDAEEELRGGWPVDSEGLALDADEDEEAADEGGDREDELRPGDRLLLEGGGTEQLPGLAPEDAGLGKPAGDTEAAPQEKAPDTDEEEVANTLRQLQDERERLTQLNGQLQARLAELLWRKTGEEARAEPQKDAAEPERRYRRCVAAIEELRGQYERDAESHGRQAEQLRLQAREKLERVESEWRALQALKRDVATEALARRVGRQAAQAQVQQIQEAEQRREKELVRARLDNVRLWRQVRRYEAALRGKEELAGGLHFIDLEQLKIENQTYAEKMEERGEELLRLRKKITSTVQVLTHLREKLHFVAEENEARRAQLADAEAALGGARDALAHTKQARDGLRADNQRLRRRCGMLGNITLLRDWEDKVSAIEELEQRLDALKRRHAELTAHCSSVKRKLQQAKGKE